MSKSSEEIEVKAIVQGVMMQLVDFNDYLYHFGQNKTENFHNRSSIKWRADL